MFRRTDAGLPQDPVYPDNFDELGYFINEKDEIRSKENPKAYFKFFLTKNDRYNRLQREAMNRAIRNEIHGRLSKLGLKIVNLPLRAAETEPHLPIYVSAGLKAKERVIILFYEHTQDIGVLAQRIIGGAGGVNAGSAVNLVSHIQSLPSSPGIILANMGQLRWWRRGRKAVTQASWYALPQQSSVDASFKFDEVKNTIPENRNAAEHVRYIFEQVVPELCKNDARLDIIGVGEGAVQVAKFLNGEEEFERWAPRVEAFAELASWFHEHEITNPAFGDWLKDRGRAYLVSSEPNRAFLAPSSGTKHIQGFGCPAFSLGEHYYSEVMLPKGYKTVISWFEEVAADPQGYANPTFMRFDDDDEDSQDVQWEEPGLELGKGRFQDAEDDDDAAD